MHYENLKLFIATIGTALTWLLGGTDKVLVILVIFMLIDFMTGLIRGFINKEISSSTGLRGIARKGLIFIMLIVAVLLDRLVNDEQWIFRTITAYFYIANEGISIIENCVSLGLPIPEKIKESLIQLKSKKRLKED